MTSKVKRDALGIHEPVYGRLTVGHGCSAFGEPVRLDQLIHPRAEPEIAFLIGRRIEPSDDGRRACSRRPRRCFAAIEVVDSRYAEPVPAARLGRRQRRGGAGRARRAGPAARPSSDDLTLHRLRVPVPRRVIDTAAAGAAMGHPAAAVAWLANALGASRGEPLEAGSVVLSGGLTASVPLAAGVGLVTAEFDGLGSVARLVA